MINFGIIGCGGIAARFAKALASSKEASLYACAAREQSRAEAFAQEHGAEKAYGDYQSLLRDEKVDAVYIATVHTAHAQNARDCILAGKPVLCEKPFFVNAREAREVITLARERQVLTVEAFWTRMLPAFCKVKEWIDGGKIGEVQLIRAAFCFCMPYREEMRRHRLWDPRQGGGALLDLGVYPYEYVTGLMGGPPLELYSATLSGPTGVDLTVSMTLKYKSALAECLASMGGWMDDTAVISGTNGYIKQPKFWGCREAELYDASGSLVERFYDPETEGFVHEIAHFAELVRSDATESPLIPLGDTLDFAQRVEGILA